MDWQPILTAPFEGVLELAIIDADGPHTLVLGDIGRPNIMPGRAVIDRYVARIIVLPDSIDGVSNRAGADQLRPLLRKLRQNPAKKAPLRNPRLRPPEPRCLDAAAKAGQYWRSWGGCSGRLGCAVGRWRNRLVGGPGDAK
jgi:hypothetical protein